MITIEHLEAVASGNEKPNKVLQDIINLSPSYMEEEDIIEAVYCAISDTPLEDWTEKEAYRWLQSEQPFTLLQKLGVLKALVESRKSAFAEIVHLTYLAIGYEYSNNNRETQ
jgi:hypothetical protein